MPIYLTQLGELHAIGDRYSQKGGEPSTFKKNRHFERRNGLHFLLLSIDDAGARAGK